MRKIDVRLMSLAAVCTAMLAVLAQVSIPMPVGVPLTLQTMAVALTGCVLGWRAGVLSVGAYLLLGAAGLPVFAGFGAGIGRFVGPTGGFLWGFLPMAAMCGLGARMGNRWAGLAVCVAGLLVCHLMGSAQYWLLNSGGVTLLRAMQLVSFPYLIKDIPSVIAAWLLARPLLHRLRIPQPA